ncbi:MAG: hypothetical protein L6R37_005873 [Teloschistes peruensis]|nr:MAG: hypothetical protein L6R37_005873 [Teloschistes peruensis]
MTFNPTGTRTGNKILRQRLKGPSVASYYPRRAATIKDLTKLYPDLETWDEDEEERLEFLAYKKARGKGAPKKKSSAAESKKILGKRRKVPAPAAPAAPKA